MLLEINNITKYYDRVVAVKDLSLTIEKPQILALLGSNGAGKSTTIKMMCGLLKPSEGSLHINDKSYADNADQLRQMIGYVPEESACYNDIGIFDYLRFFAQLYGIDDVVAQERIRTNLKKLDLDVGNKQIGQLSKGMKRKVLIVRSLLNDPDILIYDEPASGLDPQTSDYILSFMQSLQEQGKLIIFSSHNLGHVEQIADRVVIIHKGKKAYDALIDELHDSGQQYTIRRHGKTETVSLDQLKKIMAQDATGVESIHSQERTVQDVFLSLVNQDA